MKNERGLSVHLARAHDVHGPRGRLSVKAIQRFFPLLKKRRWAKAEGFLKGVVERDVEDEWRKGYAQALRGMIIALRVDHSPPQPYILQLKSYDRRRLQEAKKEFIKLSKKPLNTRFDEGYFQAWTDYIHHLLHQRNRPKKKTKKDSISLSNLSGLV
ncbi:MAG: hypothetical protein ACE5OW_07495 [Candidatus Bathyarchaeia archaeon]